MVIVNMKLLFNFEENAISTQMLQNNKDGHFAKTSNTCKSYDFQCSCIDERFSSKKILNAARLTLNCCWEDYWYPRTMADHIIHPAWYQPEYSLERSIQLWSPIFPLPDAGRTDRPEKTSMLRRSTDREWTNMMIIGYLTNRRYESMLVVDRWTKPSLPVHEVQRILNTGVIWTEPNLEIPYSHTFGFTLRRGAQIN